MIEHPQVLSALQKGYADAGSDIIYAPTFSGNRMKLAEYGLEDRWKKLIGGLSDFLKKQPAADATLPVI